jgi:membrane protease YdiL (CAAX protease family)
LAALALLLIALAFRVFSIFVLRSMGGALLSKLLGFMLILAYLWSAGRGPEEIGLHSAAFGKSVLTASLAVVTAFGCAYAAQWIYIALSGIQPSFIFAPLTETMPVIGWIGVVFFCFLNSFMEEGLFRGVMMRHFSMRLSLWQANLLQATLFGLWHLVRPAQSFAAGWRDASSAALFGLEYAAATGIQGCVWGYLYLKTNTLWAPWFAHTIANLILTLVAVHPLPTLEISGARGVGTAFASILSLFLIRLMTNRFQLPQVTPWGRVRNLTPPG